MLPPAQRPPLDIRETTLAVRISSVLGVAVNEDHPSLLDLAKIMSQTEVWHLLCHLCHFKPKKWQVPWLVTTKCSHWWVAYFFPLGSDYSYTDTYILMYTLKKKKQSCSGLDSKVGLRVIWPCLSLEGKEIHNAPWSVLVSGYYPLVQARITGENF